MTTTNPDPLRVLSLGVGTQSSALYLMSCLGLLPRLDAAIFADTQHEMPETYEYLDRVLRPAGEQAGIPLLTVSAGDLLETVIERTGQGSQPMLPVKTRGPVDYDTVGRIGAYTCSFNFKREQVTRAVKKLVGGRGQWKRPGAVEQWIGFSVDEASRMRPAEQCWCGHNRTKRTTRAERAADTELGAVQLIHVAGRGCERCACDAFAPWQVNVWPLIDLRMRRGDTLRWITDAGFPAPPRSACYFCPNRGNGHWRDLRANYPEQWANAVRLDEHVRHGMNGLKGDAYLHATGVPLALADVRPKYEQLADATGQEPLFTDEVDTDCDAGTCFT